MCGISNCLHLTYLVGLHLLALNHEFSLRNVSEDLIINFEAILAPERIIEHAGLIDIR